MTILELLNYLVLGVGWAVIVIVVLEGIGTVWDWLLKTLFGSDTQ